MDLTIEWPAELSADERATIEAEAANFEAALKNKFGGQMPPPDVLKTFMGEYFRARDPYPPISVEREPETDGFVISMPAALAEQFEALRRQGFEPLG